jgi:hypothetical protein
MACPVLIHLDKEGKERARDEEERRRQKSKRRRFEEDNNKRYVEGGH